MLNKCDSLSNKEKQGKKSTETKPNEKNKKHKNEYKIYKRSRVLKISISKP